MRLRASPWRCGRYSETRSVLACGQKSQAVPELAVRTRRAGELMPSCQLSVTWCAREHRARSRKASTQRPAGASTPPSARRLAIGWLPDLGGGAQLRHRLRRERFHDPRCHPRLDDATGEGLRPGRRPIPRVPDLVPLADGPRVRHHRTGFTVYATFHRAHIPSLGRWTPSKKRRRWWSGFAATASTVPSPGHRRRGHRRALSRPRTRRLPVGPAASASSSSPRRRRSGAGGLGRRNPRALEPWSDRAARSPRAVPRDARRRQRRAASRRRLGPFPAREPAWRERMSDAVPPPARECLRHGHGGGVTEAWSRRSHGAAEQKALTASSRRRAPPAPGRVAPVGARRVELLHRRRGPRPHELPASPRLLGPPPTGGPWR